MGDDSGTKYDFMPKGTLSHHKDGTIYWFPGPNELAGVLVPKGHALNLVEGIVGRKLSDDEYGLLFSVPINGTKRVTIVSHLVIDAAEQNPLRAVKSEVIGYIVSTREDSSRYTYGQVIGTDAFYDTDGKQQGKPEFTYKDEPGLETPFLDPLDLIGIGRAAVGIGRVVVDLAKVSSRAAPKALPKVLPKALPKVTANELELGIKPLTPQEFRKLMASYTRGEEAVGERVGGRVSSVGRGRLDTGRGARPFYAKDPKAERTVLVRLRDGTVREYKIGELRGTIKPGNTAATPHGEGQVVSLRDTPTAAGKGPSGSAANRGYRDGSGRFHSYHGTGFPTVKDLQNYSETELRALRNELQESVRERIKQNIQFGRKLSEGEQQAKEQALIQAINKLLPSEK
jgi:hypothetical protein